MPSGLSSSARRRRALLASFLASFLAFGALASTGCSKASGSAATAGPTTTTEPLPSPYDIGCRDFLDAAEQTRRGAVPSMSATIDVPPSAELPLLVEEGCAAQPERSVGLVIHDKACGVVTPDPPGTTEPPATTEATTAPTTTTGAPGRPSIRKVAHWRAGGGSGGSRSPGRNNGGGSSSSRSGSGSSSGSSGGSSGGGSGGPSVTRSGDDDGGPTPTTSATHVYGGCHRPG